MNKKIVGLLVCTLLLINFSTSIASINLKRPANRLNNTLSDDEADLPTWKVGDSWEYFVHIIMVYNPDLNFDVTTEDLRLTVVDIQDDRYMLSITANVTGSGSVYVKEIGLEIRGNLKNAKIIQGTAYVRKSDLALIEIAGLYIEGDIQGDILTYQLTANVDAFSSSEPVSLLDFPINVGESWIVPSLVMGLNYHIVIKNKLTGIILYDKHNETSLAEEEDTLNCTKKESMIVPAGTYDALYIVRDLNTNNGFWYAVDAGNIIKAFGRDIPLSGDRDGYYAIDMELISTIYEPPNIPPNPPSKPSGETDGKAGVEYAYSTSATDPNSHNKVKYGFDWGDETDITWTSLVNSGETASATHIYVSEGAYHIKAKTQDEHGAESDWSEELAVTMTPNSAPTIPTTPDGPTLGEAGIEYTFSSSTTDPDGDRIMYGWDWNGDNDVDEWSDWKNSGSTDSRYHSWSIPGTYNVKVKAQDEHGAESSWSLVLIVTISGNRPPDKPAKPFGLSSGLIWAPYSYSSSTTDPDGDMIYYLFDWGDGIYGFWLGPFNSGETVNVSHVWIIEGSYQIRVKAMDDPDGDGNLSDGVESEWSDPLSITMPKNKAINYSPFLSFLENHPHLFPLLRQLLKL